MNREKAWMVARVWLCPVLSLALAAAIGAAFGLSWWTALLLAVLLACPVTVVWSLITSQRPLPVPVGPVPATRGATLNAVAPYYDAICRAVGLGRGFRARTLRVAELRRGERVLDVGCGTGVLARGAAGIVGPTGLVWGIDPAPDMIRIARQNAATARSPASFEPAAIEALPFQDGSFDVALMSLVLHHLPPDLKRTGLQEVRRVLRPGGRIVVVDFDRPRHRLLRALLSPFAAMPALRDHLQGRTPALLSEAGFEAAAAVGHWAGILTFWRAQKPVEAR